MALQCGRPSGVVSRRGSCSSIVVAMVVLFFVVAAAERSVSARSVASRKQMEMEMESDEMEMEEVGLLKNLLGKVEYYGESVWMVLSSRVKRFASTSSGVEAHWPELHLGIRTVSAIVLSALAAALGSAAGLGGGILFVPLMKLILQFDAKTSVALSTFMITGSSAAGVALGLLRDHPSKFNQPLVDFDMVLLLQPNMILGISVGVILNSVLPNWFLTALLMVVLVYMTYNTTRSGLKRWDDETQAANAKRTSKKKVLRRSTTETEKALSESLLGFYESLKSRYPAMTILALVVVWLVVFALQLVRGGHGRQGLVDVEECGVGYWLLTASQIPVAFGVSAWIIYHLRGPPAEETGPGTSDIQDNDLALGPKEGTFFAGMALVAGLVGGMLGIGGEIIITPLLLSVGIVPEVATATSLFMLFFTSSMSAAEYWLIGRVPIAYALIAALICAVSAAAGILGLRKLVTKSGRPSLVVFLLAGVIGISAILMGFFGSQDIWDHFESGAKMGFSYPC